MLHTVLRLALPSFCALCALAIGSASGPLPAIRVAIRGQEGHTGAQQRQVVSCPERTLPDGEICVHLPGADDDFEPEASVTPNAHRTRSGRWQVYDDIPRRPDRPADYDAYRYPVPAGLPGGHSVISGYDLDKPDEAQRRGRTLRAVGHGGVDLPQARGTPARLVALEHQQGDADVLFVGPLFGTTVITRQTVREGGHLRDYVVLFGHLDAVAPGVAPGSVIKDGDVVGFVGDTGSPELVHLHWEARRVRDGVDVAAKVGQGGAALLAEEVSVVCDPRNVLPLK
jgi:murein DD-endopeptidase MepM/ murein hydrolase activator NlpD